MPCMKSMFKLPGVLCAAVSGQGWTALVHIGTSMHGVALAHGQRLNVIQILSVYFRYDHTPLPIDNLYSVLYTPFDMIAYMGLSENRVYSQL